MVCKGIGKLLYGVKYYVGMRITFDSVANLDSTTAGEKFGTLDMIALDENGNEIGTYLVEKKEIMTDFTLTVN